MTELRSATLVFILFNTLVATCLHTSSPSVARAVEDGYQSKVDRISSSQSLVDNVIKSIGRSPFSNSEPTSNGGSEDKRKSSHSLFKIHSDLKAIKLKTGQFLYGKLLNRLVVGPDGSPAIVILEDGQGSFSNLRLLGLARQSGAGGRVAIEFSKLSLPSGKVVAVSAIGLDEAGAFGVQAQVFSSKALMIAGAMTGSFIAGLAASQQSQSTNAFGFQQTQITGRNAILQGVAQTAADQSKRLIEEATAEKPILVLEPDSHINAYVQEEVKY